LRSKKLIYLTCNSAYGNIHTYRNNELKIMNSSKNDIASRTAYLSPQDLKAVARESIKKDEKIASEIRSIIKRGNLSPEEVVEWMKNKANVG